MFICDIIFFLQTFTFFSFFLFSFCILFSSSFFPHFWFHLFSLSVFPLSFLSFKTCSHSKREISQTRGRIHWGGGGAQKVMCQHAHYDERETELTFGRGPGSRVVLMLSRAIWAFFKAF